MKKIDKGFTLIELLVVISIISLLASVILASLNNAKGKARDARRKEDIHQIQLALNLYYSTNGQYPLADGAIQPNNVWVNSADASWTTLQTMLSPYLSTLPKDPLDNINAPEWAQNGYHYSYVSNYNQQGCANGQWYWLVYHLENSVGPDPGFTMCDGTNSTQYGGGGANTAVKTTGEHN